MTNTKITKRALVVSIVSLFICFTMLVGTTYAWFTDSVASGSNVIEAGNLDVKVEYTLDGKTWNDLAGASDLFGKGLWEPGHTEVVALRITNNGTLALKYNASMNIVNEVKGTNKAEEEIVLSDILQVTTVTQQVNTVGDILLGMIFNGSNATDTSNTKAFKSANVLDENKELLPGDAHYLIITVDMPETVGNEANAKDKDSVPSIEFGINVFATQFASEEDSFGNQYDAEANLPILVTSAAEAQSVLDNLEDGATIQLMPGVNYGTLEIRAQVATTKEGNKYVPVSDNDNTKPVDYFTNKYPTGEFTRVLNNITILGAPGAKVDAIKFVTGTFKAADPETGKQTGTMYRFVEINNLVIDGVEFTDKSTLGAGAGYVSPIFMDLQSVKVNGLTVKNCTLEGNVSNMNFVYAYGNAANDCTFGVTLNNVVIANNTVSGIARLAEIREANNVTIIGNNASKLTRELALLANNTDKAYSGEIICSDNVVDAIAGDYVESGREGLFFRVGLGGEANIVVKNNVITNSGCVETSFVGVTGHTGTLTVEGNTFSK